MRRDFLFRLFLIAGYQHPIDQYLCLPGFYFIHRGLRDTIVGGCDLIYAIRITSAQCEIEDDKFGVIKSPPAVVLNHGAGYAVGNFSVGFEYHLIFCPINGVDVPFVHVCFSRKNVAVNYRRIAKVIGAVEGVADPA